jgi:hypothetical protein
VVLVAGDALGFLHEQRAKTLVLELCARISWLSSSVAHRGGPSLDRGCAREPLCRTLRGHVHRTKS